MHPTFRLVIRYMASGNQLDIAILSKNVTFYTQLKQSTAIVV